MSEDNTGLSSLKASKWALIKAGKFYLVVTQSLFVALWSFTLSEEEFLSLAANILFLKI